MHRSMSGPPDRHDVQRVGRRGASGPGARLHVALFACICRRPAGTAHAAPCRERAAPTSLTGTAARSVRAAAIRPAPANLESNARIESCAASRRGSVRVSWHRGYGRSRERAVTGESLAPRAFLRAAACVLMLTGIAGFTAPAWAQDAVPAQQSAAAESAPGAQSRAWSSLSPEQQHLLAKYENGWASLPPQRQQALARGSERWMRMNPEQRALAQKRFSRWQSLPPDRRRMLRHRWNEFQRLAPQQQRAVRENFRRFRAVPPEERRVLHERWQHASPAERRNMLEHARTERLQRPPRRP